MVLGWPPAMFFSSSTCQASKNTGWFLDVLLKRPDGCKLEQFEASRHRGRSGRKVLVDRMDDAWTVENPDGITRRSNGCKGTEFTTLKSSQSLLEEHNRSVDTG
jgi:hypothetical protein